MGSGCLLEPPGGILGIPGASSEVPWSSFWCSTCSSGINSCRKPTVLKIFKFHSFLYYFWHSGLSQHSLGGHRTVSEGARTPRVSPRTTREVFERPREAERNPQRTPRTPPELPKCPPETARARPEGLRGGPVRPVPLPRGYRLPRCAPGPLLAYIYIFIYIYI